MDHHRVSISDPTVGRRSKVWRSFKHYALYVWDIIVVLSVIPSLFLVTFQVFYNAGIPWQWSIIYIADLIYIVSIVVRFLRSYRKRGVEITSKKKIALHYVCSSFFPDLISVLPLEVFCFAATNTTYVSAFLRLNRCLRCYKVWTFLSGQEKQLGTNTMLLMSLRFTFLASVCAHITAGIWFSLACFSVQSDAVSQVGSVCKPNTWTVPSTTKHGMDWNNASEFEKYIITLYWAVTTITSVGYGDIVPVTPLEKWISTVCMLIGVILFGYILGGLASMLTNADAQRSRYIHRLNTIREHLAEAKISGTLKKKVTGYYEYLWQRNKGKAATDLFDELPLAFQAELSLETYKSMIEKSPLFKDSPEEFMRMLSLVVKHMLYLPQQVILKKGDIGHHMYFVQMGEVEILPAEDSPPVAVFKEGDIFGEINLVYSAPTGAFVRAKTHCDMLLLSKADIQQVLQHFPGMSEKLEEEIKHRCDVAFSTDGKRGTDSISTLVMDESYVRDDGGRRSFGHRHSQQHHGTQSCFTKLKKWWSKHPVLPGAKFTILWDLLIVLVTIVICWVYSYQAGFTHFKASASYSSGVVGNLMLGFTYLLDLVLVADIVVSTKRAVQTPTEVITNQKTAFLSYVKSIGCYLDILSVLPLEILALIWLPTGEQLNYVALFRVNRLLKLWKVMKFFSQIESSLYISISQAMVFKFSVYILTATHLSACVWFAVACFYQGGCQTNSWASSHSISSSTTPIHDYLISLYWASATMTTVGYGDVRAHNVQEMILALVVEMIGVLLYGYCLGAIAATMTNVASPRVSFQEKIQVVHQFMFDHNLGKGLLKRVDHYFTLLWEQYKGEAIPGGQSLMHDMPQSVREDVSMEECSNLLNNIPVFKHAEPSFLRQVSLAMSSYVFAPGDIVLYNGDMGREMYCVQKGYVEIMSEDLSQVVTVLGPGSYFGELGFLFGAPRTATVRAATHCKLIMLNRRDVDKILHHFPLIEKQFDELGTDKDHLKISQEAVLEASTRAMRNPRMFAKPCTMTALAVAMATPLSVIVRSSIANTIAACVGGKDAQSKVSAPISIGESFEGTVVKFDRKEFDNLLKSDQEWTRPSSSLRQRRKHQSKAAVAPTQSRTSKLSKTSRPLIEDSEDEDEIKNRRPPSVYQRVAGCCEKMFSYFLLPYTLIPTTTFGRVWESIAFILSLVSVFTVSIQAAFVHSEPVFWTLNYLLDVFFFADMIVKLHTAYYNTEGVLITQPVACALHYFRTNFFLDIISSFPTDIVVLAAWTRNIQDVLRVLSLSRINRLLRIYKLPIAFDYLESQISRSTGIITELKFAVYMAIGTHWTACGWFLLACSSLFIGASESHLCNTGTWAFMDTLGNYSVPYQYVVSLYWATATTTTVGYGDIYAHTDLERVYATVVMIVGVVAYGYIIASVAASLANADSGRAQYQDKLKAVKSYMKDQSLDSSITKRVTNYYEYIWQRNKGVSFGSLFQGMPISLQADISLSLYKKIIDQVPLFQNTEIGFTKLLALSIKPVLFLRDEYIVRKGDIGSEMFFVNRGSVDVVSEDGTVVFASMGEGKFFGEISLVFSCPRTASIRAGTNCDLFVLTKTDLDHALKYYPHIADQIQEVANNRANLVKKRSQIAKKAAAEGKSASDAAKAAAQANQDEEEGGGKKSKEETTLKTGTSTTPHGATVELEFEDVEPSRPSCLITCGVCCKNKVWPPLKKALTFTIPSGGVFGTVLHLLGCLLSFFSFFSISYQAAFQNNSPILWGVNYIFEAYFLVEMFIKFHLAYEDSHSRTVSDFKSIALHYLKDPSGFPLDLAAIFPYELIGLPISEPVTRRAVILYFRLPHAIRVVRTQWFFSAEEKRLNQKTLLLRLLKFIVMITICTHFVACVWYMLGCQAGTCQSNTWAQSSFVDQIASEADHYCNSLYWAVATMTTTGYGDFSATNIQEMIYAIIVMVIGKLLFGFILGSIASTLANLDTQRVLFEEKLNALKDYMNEQHLSSVMRRRVLDFFDYLWVRNKGTDRQSLLSDMPYCMQAEVSLATTESLLRNVPIFAEADNAFLRHLTLVTKPCIFLPGEYIVHKGDVGLGMFLLFHGTVEVMDEQDPDKVKEVLTEGSSFGLKSLLYNTPMESSARAITHVDMFTFGQADFEHVLKDHMNMEAMINEVAQNTYGMPVEFGKTK